MKPTVASSYPTSTEPLGLRDPDVRPEVRRDAQLQVAASVPRDEVLPLLNMLGIGVRDA